jgi:hypothetical protein
VTMHGRSGTLVYMSPQQLDGERGNHLDDIYSFGACLYELLTGRPPFSSGNVDRQIREKIPTSMMQRRKELEIEGDRIDDNWERVVASCLAKDPARRPQSIAHIADHLELDTPKTKTRKAPPLPRTRRQSYGLMAGIGGVLCLLAAAVWYFGFYRPAVKPPAPMTTVVVEPPRSQAAAPATAPVFGGLIVTTSPEAATVTLGGTSMGKSPVTFKDLRPGKYPMRIVLNGYNTIEREIEVKGNEFVDLGTITLQATKSALELNSAPPGAQVFQDGKLLGTTPFQRSDFSAGEATFVLMLEGYLPGELKASLSPKEIFKTTVTLSKPATNYKGTITVPQDPSSPSVPLTIRLASDGKAGTMSQTGKHGDTVVRFNGVWEGTTLHAVTGDVVSTPAAATFSPESFSLRFSSDGSSAVYECISGGKTYVAKLAGQTTSATNASTAFKGTIRTTDDKVGPGTPITIQLAADRKSGTMTQSIRKGDIVVKFNGVLDGTTLHAVTDEVVSNPAKIQWSPESFTIQFKADGTAAYECKSGGKTYVAALNP